MSNFSLDNPSRRKTVKILTVGNYMVLGLDVIQSLAFVPLYLNFLGEKLYGLWLGTGGIISVLAFLDLGIATLTIQRISSEYGKKNLEVIGLYFFNGMMIHLCLMILLLLGGVALSFSLNSFFDLTELEYELLSKASQLASLALIITLLNNTFEGTLNAIQKPLMGKISQISGAVLGIIVTYLLLKKGYSVLAIPIGLIVRSSLSALTCLIYVLWIFRKNGISSLKFDSTIARDYLSLSPSIFLSKLGSTLVGNIEPFLITTFISPQASVFYSVTSKAGVLLRTMLDRIGSILFPSLTHFYSNEGIDKLKGFVLTYLRVLLPSMFSGFILYFLFNRQFVTIWVGEKNYLGDVFTLLIAISLSAAFFSNIMSYMLAVTGDIKYPNKAVFFESFIKLILLFTFLKFFGVYGLPLAVMTTSFAFIIVYTVRWNVHLKLKKVEFKSFLADLTRSLIPMGILAVLTYLGLYIFQVNSIGIIILLIALISIMFLFIIIHNNKFILSNLRKIS